MKKIGTITAIIFLVTAALISCKKMSEDPGAGTITGRWSLVSDSTYSAFQTVGPAIITTHNYIGAPGDYYDFETGGVLSVRRGSFSTDTAAYTLTADNKINIVYTPHACLTNCVMFANDGAGTFSITTLTAHQFVLSSMLLSPEGPFEEIMTFKK
jgi:hypothetical protein